MNRAAPLLLAAAIPAAAILSGCKTIEVLGEGAAEIGRATGAIDEQQAESIRKSSRAVAKTFEDITPEQEYYIGRAVAATILSRYPVFEDERATRYLNVLGQTLAQASDRPETFGGYHFLVLDTDEINAFAAPGGLILISRGMLRCCRSEAAVAAVLAHEIGHVENEHGLKAIRTSRLTGALTILAVESAKSLGGEDLANVTEAFEGSIDDITSTLADSGYARSAEREADRAAVRILERVGYDPRALIAMLEEMDRRLVPGGLDFAKTHPDPEDRIDDVRRMISADPSAPPPPARRQRFARAMEGL